MRFFRLALSMSSTIHDSSDSPNAWCAALFDQRAFRDGLEEFDLKRNVTVSVQLGWLSEDLIYAVLTVEGKAGRKQDEDDWS